MAKGSRSAALTHSRSGVSRAVAYAVSVAIGALLLDPVNLALGGFLTDNLALTARVSGTNVVYEAANERQVSGFFGPALQFWPSERVSNVGFTLGWQLL